MNPRHVTMLAVLVGSLAFPGVPSAPLAPRPASPAHTGLESVPARARGPVSATLGAVDRSYSIRDLAALNRGQRLRASFGRQGARISSGSGRVGLSLTAYGRGSHLIAAPPASPHASANRVTYSRGPLKEWYANGPLGLEQGFDVTRQPAGGSRPLTLSLELRGNVSARLQGGAVLLVHDGVRLRYGGLIATDARGRTLRSRLATSGERVLLRVNDHGARYPVRIDPMIQQATVTAADGAANDGFGNAVSSDGDTLAVAAVGHNGGQGAVYVFVKPASGWANAAPPAELTASDAKPGEQFAASVGVSGDTIVVGDPNHAVGSNTGQGMAYVYVKLPTGWVNATETARLTSSDDTLRGGLGISVAISGDTIVAGAWEHKVGSSDLQGAAYVFEKPPTGWADATQSGLTVPDGAANDLFGYAVAVSGNTMVVGAPGHQVGQNEGEGVAYVFVKSDAGWAQSSSTRLTPTDGGAHDGFGSRLAVSGDTVAVGSPYHRVGLSTQGAAYVFVKPFLGWFDSGQTAELTASDGATNDVFTGSMAISGNTILVGAPLHQVGPNQAQGAVYLFAKPSSAWANATQTAEVTSSDGAAGDALGDAVGGSGPTIFAGAPLRAIGADAKRGTVYVFAGVSAIAIDVPADNATYTLGARVNASYWCRPAPGETIASCAGTVASGSPIDTSRIGAHSFHVTATDTTGAQTTQSGRYLVVSSTSGTGPPRATAPKISRLTQSHRSWRRSNRPATISRKASIPVGTTFSFTLDQRARVVFAFATQAAGRKVGRRCVAQTRKNRRGPACRRAVAAGTLILAAHSGANRVSFQGRISRNRKLKPGLHAVTITAINPAGRRSKPRQLTFTVVS